MSWGLKRLLLARRQVRATAVRHLRRHADAFAQRGVRVDGFADVHGVCANFIGDSDLGSQDTAPRDNNEQLERGVLMRSDTSGRSTSYEIRSVQ